MKVLLIAGGWSTERDISLIGAKSVEMALIELGHKVTFFDLTPGFDQLLTASAAHDFAFINLHGSPGEDGLVQALLDSIGCPYQGSGPAASFLALNKAAAKQVFRRNGLPTADWEFLPALPAAGWVSSLSWPIFVKSNTGGSSLRLSKALNPEQLNFALHEIFMAGDEAILEPAIQGVDVTCGILGERALPPVLVRPLAGDFFDFKSKYAVNGASEICPAPLGESLTAKIQELSLRAHNALGAKGYSRADFILDNDGNLTLLELNTLPGMTQTSLVPQEAAAVGISFPQLLQRLIDLGMKDSR